MKRNDSKGVLNSVFTSQVDMVKNAIREKQLLKERLELNKKHLKNMKELEIKKLKQKNKELKGNLQLEQQQQVQLQDEMTNLQMQIFEVDQQFNTTENQYLNEFRSIDYEQT